MKKNIIFFIINIILFSGVIHADDRWSSYLTNNSNTDFIRDIAIEKIFFGPRPMVVLSNGIH